MRARFPLAFCINLARRSDRWALASAEFKKAGIDVRRFDAIDGETYPSHLLPATPPLKWPLTAGPYCCLLSHLSVISLAKNADLPGVLIFEDDLWLADDFKVRCDAFLREVPDDWDMIYLNGRVMLDRARVSTQVVRPSYVYNCFAYAVSAKAYDRCIAALRTKAHWNDQLLAGLHPQMSVYMPAVPFAWQRNDLISDNKDKNRERNRITLDTSVAGERASLSRKSSLPLGGRDSGIRLPVRAPSKLGPPGTPLPSPPVQPRSGP
ncbi:MAG: glycosyltransferase family 25 protein [Bacteroidota bacterium]|jgi:GR25 family glycosyltransferase involved in LPS biosynthesis